MERRRGADWSRLARRQGRRSSCGAWRRKVQTSDATAFSRLMVTLSEVFGGEATSVKITAYFEALRSYDLEYVEKAVKSAISESEFFPKPVELREWAAHHRANDLRTARELRALE